MKRGDPAVVPTDDPTPLLQLFRSCMPQAQTNNPWGVPEERSVRVYVCRGATTNIQDLWPSLAGRN